MVMQMEQKSARYWILRVVAGVSRWWPIVVIVPVYASWFAAWQCIGHMPRPGIDDPGSIGCVRYFDIPVDTALMSLWFMPWVAIGTNVWFYDSHHAVRLKRMRDWIRLAWPWIAMVMRWRG